VQLGVSLAILAIYFAPSIVAFFKRAQDRYPCLAINLFLGWTLIGWAVCWWLAIRTPATEKRALMAQAVADGVMRAQTTLSPGWYPDQSGSGQRWWDGSKWTDARLDANGQPAPPS
jgi:hypothetical protein